MHHMISPHNIIFVCVKIVRDTVIHTKMTWVAAMLSYGGDYNSWKENQSAKISNIRSDLK